MTCGPPRKFRPAGNVRNVSVEPAPAFIAAARRRGKGAKAAGMRYEERVHEHFADEFGDDYLPGPWFRFESEGAYNERWCQPDGLIVLPETRQLFIIEAKLRHTATAWWQVERLYRPVLEWMFLPGVWEIAGIEVVRWYDPLIPFPERPDMVASPLLANPGKFAVHIWKPGR